MLASIPGLRMRARTVVSCTVIARSDRPIGASTDVRAAPRGLKLAAYRRHGEICGRLRDKIRTLPMSGELIQPHQRQNPRRKLRCRAQRRPTERLGTCTNRRKRAHRRQFHPLYAVSECGVGNHALHHVSWYAGTSYARQNYRARHRYRPS